MKTYDLNFPLSQVYKFDELPADTNKRGIYVIRETSDVNPKEWYIHKILYIGMSTRFSGRLTKNHEHIDDSFKEATRNGHFITICYAVMSGYSEEDIKRAENALIFSVKPKFNSDNKDYFNYDDTTVNLSGERSTLFKNQYICKKE